MTRRTSRAEIGNAVFAALTQAPYTIEEGTSATGLSVAQWRTGLQYVREVCEHYPDAITYDAATKRYHLAVQVVEYFVARHIQRFTREMASLYDGQFCPNGCDWSPALKRFNWLDIHVQLLLNELHSVTVSPDGQVLSDP